MPELDLRTAATLVGSPDTSAHALAQIAADFPELWDQITVHPNVYPDLLAWIAMARTARGDTSPQWAPREAATSAEPQDTAPQNAATPMVIGPGARTRRAVRRPLIAAGAVSFCVAVALVVTLVVTDPFSNRKLDELLALVGLPEDSQNFALDISYPDRVAVAMGSDLPLEKGSRGVSRWAADAGEGSRQHVDLDIARMSPWWIENYGSIPLHADAQATLTRRVCDPEHCEERELGVWAGTIPGELLDEGFTSAGGGEWHPAIEGVADPQVVSLREGGMFHRSSFDLDDGMRFAETHHAGSLADDDAALRVLRTLNDTGGYAIGISRWEDAPSATSGYAIGKQGDRPHMTLVWDVPSASGTLDFAATASTQITQIGDSHGLRLQPAMQLDGTLVILDFTFSGTSDGLGALRAALLHQLLGNPPPDIERVSPGDDAGAPVPGAPTPDEAEPTAEASAAPPAPDPSLLAPCSTAPTFAARSAEYADHSLRLRMAVTATCPAGDVLAGPDHHVLVEGPSVLGEGTGLPVTIAQGAFGFSDPLPVPSDGTEITLVFGPGQYFQDVTPMDLTQFTITHVPDPTPAKPLPLPEQAPAHRITYAESPEVPRPSDPTAAETLNWDLERDRPLIESDLTGHWTPQLASAKAGSPADEQSFMEELGRQRAHYPSAKLIHSDDWPVFAPNGPYWVVVAGIPFETSEEVLRWCEDEGFDADSCFAKRLDPHGTFESSTRYR